MNRGHKILEEIEQVLEEAGGIALRRSRCLRTLDDFTAICLLAKLVEEESQEALESVRACLERMKIAEAQGVYPIEMLADHAGMPSVALQRKLPLRLTVADHFRRVI